MLLALLETRTFSGAGVKLGINTSTVGRRLEALESVLGARLFERTPDGVLPTVLAEDLKPYAEALERSAAQFALAAQSREQAVEGDVKITAPPGIAEHMIAPALPRLLSRWPKLRVTLDASISYADLTRREADIALRAMRPEQGDLISLKLGEAEDVPFASPEYAASLGVVRSLEEARWISWGESLSHIPSARWVLEQVPSASIVLRTNSIGAQLGATEAGLGVALFGRPYGKMRRLAPIQLSEELQKKLPPTPRGSVWLVGHRAMRDLPRISAVWDFLKEEAHAIGL